MAFYTGERPLARSAHPLCLMQPRHADWRRPPQSPDLGPGVLIQTLIKNESGDAPGSIGLSCSSRVKSKGRSRSVDLLQLSSTPSLHLRRRSASPAPASARDIAQFRTTSNYTNYNSPLAPERSWESDNEAFLSSHGADGRRKMPGVIKEVLSSDEEVTLKKSDAPSPTRNFSKLLRPSSRSMDAETLDLAKDYPYLVTADLLALSESSSDDERKPSELVEQYRHEEVRIRDFAFQGPALDQISQKATQSSSSASAHHGSSETATQRGGYAGTESAIGTSLWGPGQNSSASPKNVASPQTVRHSPLNVLSSSTTENILLNAAPPFNFRTMNAIPASRKNSGTPSPPPNKPLPPLPEAQGSPDPPLEAPQSTSQETTAFSSGHEPPIPPKSPRRSKRNTLHIADDRELEALVSLNSSVRPKDNRLIRNPDLSEESGSSSPIQGSDEVIRTHDDLLQWRELRNEKTQARKKRDLAQSRALHAEHQPTNGMHDSKPDIADDTDDTIILPSVTSSKRSSVSSTDKPSQPPHLDRWNHLKAVTDSKTPPTFMAPSVVQRPTSSLSLDTRSLSPQPQRRSPTKAMGNGEAVRCTATLKTPVVLQPAPLRTGRNVRLLSATRPLYKHNTQGALYIPPSPPLSPTAPTFDEDTTAKKLSNRASFAQHRSGKRSSTIIEPENVDDPEDFSLYPSEIEVQLQAELAAEKKRSTLLKVALVAMINASAQFDSPPSSEAGNRLSSLSGKSTGSGPLESTLEAMLDCISGGKM
ncbi:hypothetical protein MMC18_006006 [Xylographa bjoerkii]|nr:hypothetical protein [Xylographa bjoerkii]